MIRPKYLVKTGVIINLISRTNIAFKQNTITIRRRLILLIFIVVVIAIQLICWKEMNLCFIIEWILWTVRSVLGLAVGKDCWEVASAHADLQLVFFVYYCCGVLDVFGHHFFKVGVQAVV